MNKYSKDFKFYKNSLSNWVGTKIVINDFVRFKVKGQNLQSGFPFSAVEALR